MVSLLQDHTKRVNILSHSFLQCWLVREELHIYDPLTYDEELSGNKISLFSYAQLLSQNLERQAHGLLSFYVLMNFAPSEFLGPETIASSPRTLHIYSIYPSPFLTLDGHKPWSCFNEAPTTQNTYSW